MSEKIERSQAGFGKRVMIGGNRVWLIVEGIGHDVYFYDRVLRTNDRIVTAGHDVNDASSIKFDGSEAGGKKRLLAMHDYYKRRGELRQVVDGDEKLIFFALDKDLDGITGQVRKSPHLLYTEYRDVEAEIFARGDMESALAVTLSLTQVEAAEAARHVGDPMAKLAGLWVEWILICALIMSLRVGVGVKPGGISTINGSGYGPVTSSKFALISSKITSHPRYSGTRHSWIEGRVRSRERRGTLNREVKGKLVVGYVDLLCREHFKGKRRVDFNAIRPSLAKQMLMSVRFESAWAERWTTPIERLLN